MDLLSAMISGTLGVFAIMMCAPALAQLPALVRRLRRRWLPSGLLGD